MLLLLKKWLIFDSINSDFWVAFAVSFTVSFCVAALVGLVISVIIIRIGQ